MRRDSEIEQAMQGDTGRARREVREGHFTTHDGESLFYRHWPAAGTPLSMHSSTDSARR